MGEVITAPVLMSLLNLVGLLFKPKERQREKNHLRPIGKGGPGNFMNTF